MVYTTALVRGLPFLTDDLDPVDAIFRAAIEDFEVEEVPVYPPSGEGDHTFAWIEKRDLTTKEAVRRLCAHVETSPKDAGWAGMKDRRAVTRQWVSLHGTSPDALRSLELDGIRVLQVARHPQKLRTGHLKANRFRIRLREVESTGIPRLRAVLDRIETLGLPNYYGEQRFGREGQNAVRALRWVRGEARPPRQAFKRKLEMSALQSELFNRRLAERVRTGTLGRVFDGDVMKKHETGGVFVATDVEVEQARADSGETSPTGPIFGAKMRWPEGDARAREEQLLSEADLTPDHFARFKRIAPGTRRLVRVFVQKIKLSVSGDTVLLDFTLPAGSYATILVREIRKRDASMADSG